MSESALSPKQLTALESLLGGATNTAAAEAAGVNRCTIKEWRSQPQFQAAMRDLQGQRAESIRNHFAAMAEGALQTVQGILSDGSTPPATRLKAALSIIQAAAAPPQPAVHIARDKGDDLDRLFAAAYLVARRESAIAAPSGSPRSDDEAKDEEDPQESHLDAAAQTPRNAPCTCGSGAKFKRCCGVNAPPVQGGPAKTHQNPPE